jgi:hypothetical protein
VFLVGAPFLEINLGKGLGGGGDEAREEELNYLFIF